MTAENILGFVSWAVFGALFWYTWFHLRRKIRVARLARGMRLHQDASDAYHRKHGSTVAGATDDQIAGLISALEDHVDQLAGQLRNHTHRMHLDPADQDYVRRAAELADEVTAVSNRVAALEIVERWSESE